jgi:hypothetical protein
VEGGAHQRAPSGGDGGRGGAALCCAWANAREEEVCGAHLRLGWLSWARRAASCCACSAVRALARRVYAVAARLPWRGHLARLEARGHLVRCGRVPARIPGPRASAYGRKYADRVGTPRCADVATSRPERTGALERFRVALFNWLKQ